MPLVTPTSDPGPAPAVTVVVPTYNRGAMLREALGSLASQTTADFEVVVVDDGSEEDIAAVVSRHSLPVRFIRTPHAGLAGARNTGMAAARGRYIAYLDSDDLYYPFKLALQTTWLDRHPHVGMVYTEFSAFSDEGFWDERHLKTYHRSAYRSGANSYARMFSASEDLPCAVCASLNCTLHPIGNGRAYVGDIYDTYLRDMVVFTNSMMFRRELLERAGYQSPRFGFFHDLEFAQRLCKAAPTGFLDVPTYKLRYHPGQVTTTVGPKRERIALHKQQHLLRVLRVHVSEDPCYYLAHKQDLDASLGRLACAAAIPLMTFGSGSRHEARAYRRRARAYLRFAARHGRRTRVLTLLTFAPAFLRRAHFAIAERLSRRMSRRRRS